MSRASVLVLVILYSACVPEVDDGTNTSNASVSAFVDSLEAILALPPTSSGRWVSERGLTDRMTGDAMWSAMSPYSYPQDRMAYTYYDEGIRARLMFSCRGGGSEFVSIFFTKEPSLPGFWGNEGFPRMRWDDEVVRMEMTHTAGELMVMFEDDAAAERRIRRHNTLLFEVEWGGVQTYFEFPLVGAARSIDDARRQCAGGA